MRVRMAAIAIGLAVTCGGAALARAGKPACSDRVSWRGPAISVDLKDVDLQDAFRFLADAGDVSIVVGDDVRGKVTVRLKKVPWEQAMCTIAASKRLEVEVDGTVYLVTARAPR